MANSLIEHSRVDRVVWLGVISILVVLLVIVFINNKRVLSIAGKKEQGMVLHIEALQALIDSMMKTKQPTEIQPGIDKYEMDELRRMGLEDPINDLRDDLEKHRELIPYEGIHGAKMGFCSRGDIRIINSKWVFADFEDGHIGGSMILKYRVKKDGKISWKVIDSYLD